MKISLGLKLLISHTIKKIRIFFPSGCEGINNAFVSRFFKVINAIDTCCYHFFRVNRQPNSAQVIFGQEVWAPEARTLKRVFSNKYISSQGWGVGLYLQGGGSKKFLIFCRKAGVGFWNFNFFKGTPAKIRSW